MITPTSDKISLTVEFLYATKYTWRKVIVLTAGSGGLDALFANQRKINISLPAYDQNGHAANMEFLIRHLYEQHLTDRRKEFFVLDDTVLVYLIPRPFQR